MAVGRISTIAGAGARGRVHVRPYYAPALVAFVGGGGGLRISAGTPVGWFPLGPRDVYVPGYRVSHDYFTRINVNNSRISNASVNNFYGNYARGNFDYTRVNYANRNIAGAVVAVSGAAFVGAHAIRGSALAVNRNTFANARVSGFAAIAPTRSSLAFQGGRKAVAPPHAIVNRKIIAATRPPPPVTPFAQRESQLQRNPGRALPVSQLHVAPGVRVGAKAQPAGVIGRPNVNVVTTNGQPVRSPAAAIKPHNAGNPAQADNGRGPALRGNPQQQQGSLPSSRYVKPNTPDRAAIEGQHPQTSNNAQVQQRTQQEQQAQDRSARQQQVEQQRAQQQQAQQQREAAQQTQQQHAQQEQQAQERATRQQQIEQQRTQQQQAQQQREAAQQQQMQQRAQQEQERVARQQQVQQQHAQQQAQQAHGQQQQQAREDQHGRDDKKDDNGHR